MKILLSPSKTQHISHTGDGILAKPLFLAKSLYLVEQLNQMTDSDLCQKLHIPQTQYEQVIAMYRQFGAVSGSAIESYTGEAFKYLKLGLSQLELKKLQDRLYIFSALYGLLRPFDEIHPYRLDMTMRVLSDQTLVQFWKEDINTQLRQEKEILSLASKEFEKLVEVPYYRVEFFKHDGNRVHTVLAKQMRGMLAQHIIMNECDSIEAIKNIELNGFCCHAEESKTLLFYSTQ